MTLDFLTTMPLHPSRRGLGERLAATTAPACAASVRVGPFKLRAIHLSQDAYRTEKHREAVTATATAAVSMRVTNVVLLSKTDPCLNDEVDHVDTEEEGHQRH